MSEGRTVGLGLSATLGTVALLCGCGDGLVSGAYRGEPLLELQGKIISTNGGDPSADPNASVAVFWAGSVENASFASVSVSGVEQGVEFTRFGLTAYRLSIFTPPPDAVLQRARFGAGRVALGQVVSYNDRNGDGRWTPQEDEWIGGVDDTVIVYTPDGASGGMFMEPLGPGFHVLTADDIGDQPNCFPPDAKSDDPQVQVLVAVSDTTRNLSARPEKGTDAVYIDLDCDDRLDEWLPSHCPASFDEFLSSCSPNDGGFLAVDGVDQALCDFCGDLRCDTEPDPCSQGCETHHRCVAHNADPNGQQQELCVGECEGDPGAGLCSQCQALVGCEQFFSECVQGGADPNACEAERINCYQQVLDQFPDAGDPAGP